MANVTLTPKQVGDVTVIEAAGRITLGESSMALREAIRGAMTSGAKKIVLNLGEITYIDSSGIGELVSGFTTMSSHGGALKLLKVTKRVQELLQVTRLYTVFQCFDDEASAVNSFGPPTPTA